MRLSTKSTPSKTGGRSSNSGTDWPGTNSARWTRISVVDGAIRTRTPRRVGAVDELEQLALGEVRVDDDHLVDAVVLDRLADSSSEPSERRPLCRARRARDEADDLDRRAAGAAASALRDGLDVRAGADEHRAAAVAGGAQQQARDPLVDLAEGGDVDEREEERAVEDVVGGVELVRAADDREDHRDDHHLEQRREDPREAGALAAVGVHVRAREQQHGDEVGEGDDRARLVEGLASTGCACPRTTSLSSSAVKIARKTPAKSSAISTTTRAKRRSGRPAQQEREQRRALRAHVALAEADRLRRRQRSRGRCSRPVSDQADHANCLERELAIWLIQRVNSVRCCAGAPDMRTATHFRSRAGVPLPTEGMNFTGGR